MATPSIKATYSLDVETTKLLESVARKSGISKSEALRRAIRAAAAAALGPTADSEQLALLDRAQRLTTLSPAAAAAWTRGVRSERHAGSARRRCP